MVLIQIQGRPLFTVLTIGAGRDNSVTIKPEISPTEEKKDKLRLSQDRCEKKDDSFR